jgi:endoglycosylceramidase
MSKRILPWFAAGFLLLAAQPTQAEFEPLHAAGRALRDARGGTVVLRGLNLTGDAKVPPFRGIDDVHQLDVLSTWGVNVVRLLFTWEAFEPQRGQYDQSYLDYYTSLIDALSARDVRVIVDFHQDGFSRYASQGCGDGFPGWAVSQSVLASAPDNAVKCTSWGILTLLDLGTARCWDDFYANQNGVRERYLSMLDRVSERLQDHAGVLGYDMLNEPAGDEGVQLAPLYDDAARVLRANDSDAIMFVSPGMLTSAGTATALPRPRFDNFVYSPHYYDAAVSQLHTWLGTSLAEPVRTMVDQAASWNAPLFLAEFGAPSDGIRADEYLDEFYNQLDANLLSAAQWNFTPHWTTRKLDGWNQENFSVVDDQGRLQQTYRVRAFPARVAGEITSFSASKSAVELSWQHDPAAGETRVFAPIFAGKLAIQASGDVQCAYESGGLYLRCTSGTQGKKTLRLQPCAASEASCVMAE